MRPFFIRILFFLLFAAVLAGLRFRRPAPSPAPASSGTAMDPALAQPLFPLAAKVWLPANDSGGWMRVEDAEGRLLGALADSRPAMDSITGYGGPTPLLIGAGPDGRIIGIHLLDNHETPGFVRRVLRSGYLEPWIGRTIPEGAGLEVDAVSGATFTSSAIARTIRGRLAMSGPDLESPLPSSSSPQRIELSLGWTDGVILLLVGMALAFSHGLHRRFSIHLLPRLRLALQIFSIGILGLWTGSMLSMDLLNGWARSGLIHAGLGLVVLVAAALAVPLFTGRNPYCHFLCPFGAAQEILFRIAPFKRKVPPGLFRHLHRLRRIVLLALTVSLLLDLGFTPSMQEPFSAFRWSAAGGIVRILAMAALLTALAGIHRPWCSFFCSTGALLDLLRWQPSAKSHAPTPPSATPAPPP